MSPLTLVRKVEIQLTLADHKLDLIDRAVKESRQAFEDVRKSISLLKSLIESEPKYWADAPEGSPRPNGLSQAPDVS